MTASHAAEKELLGSSAEVFALLIENARLNERALEQEKLRRDLALAAEVQRRLLPPHPPRCGSATLAAFTLPARTVGGDYYDFLDLPGDRIGIAVADVAGKGIAAALLMSVVQASLRVISGDGELRAVAAGGEDEPVPVRVDHGNQQVRDLLLRAARGRRPAAALRQRGTQSSVSDAEDRGRRGDDRLSAGGTVLGLFPEVEYEEADIDLRPGDLVVAFTDGVPEALNADGEEFGEERLKDLLREAAAAPAEEVSVHAGQQDARVDRAERSSTDDLTFVVVAVH